MRQPNASLPENLNPQQQVTVPSGPKLKHVTEQPDLPIKFDSKRGCDQIRARLYHDHRLIGLELPVALAVSEFVNLATFAAYPKQKLLARMVHATQPRVSNALQRLETKRVIEIDRKRSYCRYVFLAEWRGRFRVVPKVVATDSRYAGKAYLDMPEKHISNAYTGPQLPLDSASSTDDHELEPLTRTLGVRASRTDAQSGVVRTKKVQRPVSDAPSPKGLASTPTVEEVLEAPSRGEPRPKRKKFEAQFAAFVKTKKRRRVRRVISDPKHDDTERNETARAVLAEQERDSSGIESDPFPSTDLSTSAWETKATDGKA